MSFKDSIQQLGREMSISFTCGTRNVEPREVVSFNPHFEARLLGSCMKCLDIELDGVEALPSSLITGAKVGCKAPGSATEDFLSYGTYIIKGSERDDDTGGLRLECYDKMLEAMVPYDLALDYSKGITVKGLLDAVCNHFGWVKGYSSSFTNASVLIDGEKFDNTYTYRSVLDEIAQVSASIIVFDNQDRLCVRYPGDLDGSEIVEPSNQKSITLGQRFGPVNSVVLARSPQEDNIYRREEGAEITGEIRIENNQIMDSHRDDFIQGIYNRLHGLSYYLYEVESYGMGYLQPGQKFTLETLDGTQYPTILLSDNFSVGQGVSETLSAEAPETAETDYRAADTTDRRINQTYLRVDKQLQEISGVVTTVQQESGQAYQMASEAKQTAEGLTSTVKKTVQDEVTEQLKDLDSKNAVVDVDVEYYLSTSTTSLSGGSWSTKAPDWVDGKYMWSRTKTTMADGTISYSPSASGTCIAGATGKSGKDGKDGTNGINGTNGLPGKDGVDGKTTYFHVKYSSVASPSYSSQMTETPSEYIGTCVDYTEADPTDPKKYTWSKFQGKDGSNGIPGTNGTDGKTSYLHIAYANSANGATGFSVSDSTGKLYIGQYTDFSQADSTDYRKYSWTRIRGEDGTNGVPGKDGKDGKTTYFHIKYSSVASPTSSSQMTETPSDYIGTYVDYTEADSNDPTKYAWVKWIGQDGENGIPGKNGTDGKTSYLHIAYANSADGRTGFSTTDSTNKEYIGQYTDFTQADSTSYSKYSWTKIKGKDGTNGKDGSNGKDGTDGADGRGVESITPEYYLSTSKESPTGGSWSATPPTWENGKYIWTRSKIVYKDPAETVYTEASCDTSWEAANDALEEANANTENAVGAAKSELSAQITSVSTTVQQLADSLALTIVQTMMQSDEWKTMQENITKVTATANGLNVDISTTTSNLEGFLDEFHRFFQFTSDGLIQSVEGSPYSTLLGNERLSLRQGGEEVAYIQYNRLYVTEACIKRLSVGFPDDAKYVNHYVGGDGVYRIQIMGG